MTIHDGSSSDLYHFDAVNSSRLRFGLRWTHEVNKYNTFFLGAAFQHEFDGTARASYEGEYTPSPSVKGNSGVYELGWRFTGEKGNSLDLNCTGWSGKQEGVTFSAKFNWAL